jgi:uncharacterized damage-inducible protein DinB
MYRKIEDFVNDWAYETEMTLKILNGLTDESLTRSFHDGHRTLGRLAWHITYTLTEMTKHAGLPMETLGEMPENLTVEKLVTLFARDAGAVKNAVAANWTDDSLTDKVPMYSGEEWRKGVVLSILIRHQTHHRGQMTVLMRQAGLTVAGVYGPAKEEWVAMGMPAMA